MTTLSKRIREAKKDAKRKRQTLYRLISKKDIPAGEHEINLGLMVITNELGEITGKQFAIDNFRNNPNLYYVHEQNFKPADYGVERKTL